MIWCLALNSKNSITKKKKKKQQHKKPPSLHTHTQHKLKFSMTRFQYLGHRERVHRSFINNKILCDFRFHCRRLMFCLYSLRYTYVFKMHVRTYFKKSIWTNPIICNTSKRFSFTTWLPLDYRYIILVWRASQIGEYANSAT